MRKKGFTLIELAIVLVIIGLLLGMAKGKALVDAAKVKSEITKMQKLGTAFAGHYAKYSKFPGIQSAPIRGRE